MDLTHETPNAAAAVPTPMETSPGQTQRSTAVGMDVSGEFTLVGEMVTPLEIIEPVLVNDTPQAEETTVEFPEEKTPVVAPEKGSSSAAIPRGKRTKVLTDGPLRAARRRRRLRLLAEGKGCPSVQPLKKQRTTFIALSDGEDKEAASDEEDKEAASSPAPDVAPTSDDSSSSDSMFDDTESDEDFLGEDSVGDESSDEDSLDCDETLNAWMQKKGKSFISDPTSKPTEASTSSKGKAKGTIDVDLDSDVEVYEDCEGRNPRFYSTVAEERWSTVGVRKCFSEKKIDMSSFESYKMTSFLIQCGMMPTVSYAVPYVSDVVKLVYANITKQFLKIKSKHYGSVYVRGSFYNISPEKINSFFKLDEVDDDEETLYNMNEVTQHITGGRVQMWSSGLKVSDLTAMHNVLHKLTITNWLPSSNSTSVTHSQATLIYKLSCGVKVDVGKMMFNKIFHEAKSKSQSGILPYPSLIYQLLCSQNFVKEKEDPLTPVVVFKITPSYLTGDCVIDLPWVPRHQQRTVADVDNSVETCVETLAVPQAFLRQELERCDERIRLFSSQLHQAQEMRSKLVILLSSQKGGVNGGEGGSGTAGEPPVQGEENEGAGADGGEAGAGDDREVAKEGEGNEEVNPLNL